MAKISRREPDNVPKAGWEERLAKELQDFTESERGMWGDLDENLVAQYIDRRCTPEEKAKVERAMKHYPAIRELVETVQGSVAEGDRTGVDQTTREGTRIEKPWERRLNRPDKGTGKAFP